MPHQSMDPAIRSCIDACKTCHDTCLETAMTHCLELGGAHVEAEHMRLMVNCAEICQTSANFMLSRSAMHAIVCGACAAVCDACAQSCEKVGDMQQCVDACRRCAQSCREMSAMFHPGAQTGATQRHPAPH